MNKLLQNRLLLSIGSYTLVNIVNKGIPFLMLPFLTHYLTKKDFGILTNIESLLTLAVICIGINAPAAFTRQYVKTGVRPEDYFVTVICVMACTLAVFSGIFWFFAGWLSNFTAIPEEIILFVSVYAFLDLIMEILLSLWRLEDKPFRYGTLRIVRTIIEMSVSLVLVISFEFDWFGRFLGIFSACISGGLIAFLFFRRIDYFKGVFRKEYLGHLLRFGGPLIPHSASGVIIFYSDKLVLTNLVGVEENGVYSVGFTIGMALGLIQNSFNQAWLPWFYKKLEEGEQKVKSIIVRYTYYYSLGLIFLAVVLWLLTPIIYSVFIGKDFHKGMPVVFLIALGFAFNGMYKMMVNYLFYKEKTGLISVITLGLAALNIYLNILFVKSYDMIGAAYASLITFVAQFLITWFVSTRVYPMPWFRYKRH